MKVPYGCRIAADGNTAAALGAALAQANVVAAYPITPQTVAIERLAEIYAGRRDVIFKNMESEHGMLGYAITASHLGARVFTATSSQGLLYAHEQAHRAGRERTPVVMAVVNRSLSYPWNLEPDLNDSMSQRDCGWLQFYCANHQEILDTILLSYKVAEAVLLPAMVIYEGFILSHSTAALDVPTDEKVSKFLPPFNPPEEWLINPDVPRTYFQLPNSTEDYVMFQYYVEKAMEIARGLIDKEAENFSRIFGRAKTGLIEVVGKPDAKVALVTAGTIGETAKILTEEGDDVSVVRVHAFRPFPSKLLKTALAKARRIIVVDRATSFGGASPLAAEVVAAVGKNRVRSFIAGIGGNNVTEETLRDIIKMGSRRSPSQSVWILEEGRQEVQSGSKKN